MCLVVFVVDFGWQSICILWVGGNMFPSDRIGSFVVKVIVREWICILSVCHESGVI